jgi:FMN reductase
MTESATSTKHLAVVTAGLSQPSSTRLLADRLTESVVQQAGAHGSTVEVTVVDLRDLGHDIVNNLITGFPSPALAAAIETVSGADGLIAVTPIFSTSYSGLFKSFIDVLDPVALTDLPVLIGATGGTERHSLALEYAMRPLFTYLHAMVVPTSVYAASSDWGSGGDASGALPQRIGRAAGELAALVATSSRSTRLVDPFALPEGFSPVGGYGAQ